MSDTDQLDGLERVRFGADPTQADRLLALVLSGAKTATCWAARHGQLKQIGQKTVVCDGAGQARAVLETLSLDRRRFCDVDEKFAQAEGEDDLSLASWRSAHSSFFADEGAFSEDMDLWCEHFQVVSVLLAAG